MKTLKKDTKSKMWFAQWKTDQGKIRTSSTKIRHTDDQGNSTGAEQEELAKEKAERIISINRKAYQFDLSKIWEENGLNLNAKIKKRKEQFIATLPDEDKEWGKKLIEPVIAEKLGLYADDKAEKDYIQIIESFFQEYKIPIENIINSYCQYFIKKANESNQKVIGKDEEQKVKIEEEDLINNITNITKDILLNHSQNIDNYENRLKEQLLLDTVKENIDKYIHLFTLNEGILSQILLAKPEEHTIGNLLKSYRKEKSLTLRELSKEASKPPINYKNETATLKSFASTERSKNNNIKIQPLLMYIDSLSRLTGISTTQLFLLLYNDLLYNAPPPYHHLPTKQKSPN